MDAGSGLVHKVIGTAANVNDVTQAAGLLLGKEKHAWGEAGCHSVDKRREMQGCKAQWYVAMRQGKRKALDPTQEQHKLLDKA